MAFTRNDLFGLNRELAALSDVQLRPISTATNLVATVGTASTVVLNARADRKAVEIVNDSDTGLYFAIGAPAVVGKGLRINSAGGSFEINWTNLYTGTISAIGTGANKGVTVMEGW